MEKKEFSRKEMEELLPDYLFGRLSAEESKRFERSLPQYPDLESEIEEVRKIFRLAEKIDFNRLVEKKTKNIEERVLSKLNNRRQPLSIFALKPIQVAVAALGIILLVVSLKFLNKDRINSIKNQDEPIALQTINHNLFNINFDEYFSDTTVDDNFEISSFPFGNELGQFLTSDGEFQNEIDARYQEALLNLIGYESFERHTFLDSRNLLMSLDELDDEVMLDLIKELKNEKI